MITATQTNDAINYMVAMNLFTPKPGMAAVWAEYVNSAIPDVEASELAPAAKLIVSWRELTPGMLVTPETLVKAIRKKRSERIQAELQRGGQLLPEGLGDEPLVEREWVKAAYVALGRGASREAAEAFAWSQIGRTPPVGLPAAREMNIKPLIQQALRAAKKAN